MRLIVRRDTNPFIAHGQQYLLVVYFHSTVTGEFSEMRAVRVTID